MIVISLTEAVYRRELNVFVTGRRESVSSLVWCLENHSSLLQAQDLNKPSILCYIIKVLSILPTNSPSFLDWGNTSQNIPAEEAYNNAEVLHWLVLDCIKALIFTVMSFLLQICQSKFSKKFEPEVSAFI